MWGTRMSVENRYAEQVSWINMEMLVEYWLEIGFQMQKNEPSSKIFIALGPGIASIKQFAFMTFYGT